MTIPTMATIPTSYFLLPSLVQSDSSRNYCKFRRSPYMFSSFHVRASLSTPGFPLASRIVVKNLPYLTSESSLREEFSSFGEVAEVKVLKFEEGERRKAHAFIQYTCLDDAFLALENMDRKMFDGRMIYVEVAKPGKRSFGEYPTASGPPKGSPAASSNDQDDCWY
ncbi:unnamed protein product [Linum trigynum]|uniref:RRM domain-containing protein n=1 Tax=Linum trigynum TaxID=586398 RepID=A0AAV2FVW0_9ROSI